METFLAWIVDQGLQIALLAALVLLASCCLKRRFPHLVWILWLALLIKSLLPPIGFSNFSLAKMTQELPVAYESRKMLFEASHHESRVFRADPAYRGAVNLRGESLDRVSLSPQRFPWGPTIIAGYFFGLLLFVGREIGAWLRFAKQVKNSRIALPGELQALSKRVAEKLNFRGKYRVVVVDAPVGTAIYGLWTPTIIIPKRTMEEANERELETALCHEFIHARRRDHLLSHLQTLCRMVWWFHPAVWLAVSELEKYTEFCCDEELLALQEIRPAEYGKRLLALVESQAGILPQGMLRFGTRSRMRERLLQILNRRHAFTPGLPSWCVGVALAVALVALPGAGQDSGAPVNDYDRIVREFFGELERFPADSPRRPTMGDSTYPADVVEKFIPRFLESAANSSDRKAADEALWWVIKFSEEGVNLNEQTKAFGRKYPQAQKYLDLTRKYAPIDARQKLKDQPAFLRIAEEQPSSPVALDALLLLIGNFEFGPDNEKMLKIFRENHVESPYLARRHLFGRAPGVVEFRKSNFFTFFHQIDYSATGESILLDIMKKNPVEEIRLTAQLTLAQRMLHQGDIAESVQSAGPERRAKMAKDYLQRYLDIDPAASRAKAAGLLRGLLASGEGVLIGREATPAREAAKRLLFAGNNLRVGQWAPDIEGVDAYGEAFKLSDYNGQVRLVIFSGTWCAPCRQLYPKLRKLMETYKAQPFTVLAVNADDSTPVRKAMESGDITWRTWIDGRSGPVCKQWNVEGFPTGFLIDHKGMIRKIGTDLLQDSIEKEIAVLVEEARAR